MSLLLQNTSYETTAFIFMNIMYVCIRYIKFVVNSKHVWLFSLTAPNIHM